MKHDIQYDYDNQAWIIDGVYQDCHHPVYSEARPATSGKDLYRPGAWPYLECCYGRVHKGKRAPNIH